MLFVMPSQRSSVLIFAAIHLSSFLRSPTTDPASLILRRGAEKDSDFPTCGPGPKNWVHNSMFELRRVAAPASSFSYRSIDELCSLEVVTALMSQRLRPGSSFDVPTGICSVSFVRDQPS